MSHRVLVAGGGPTGLMLACELALQGVETLVLERAESPRTRSAGMAMHGRSLELLAMRGLAERIPAEQLVAWPRTPFALMWLDLDTVDERDHTIALPQWRTEALLERRAVELGVEVRRGCEVTGFEQDEAGVTVEIDGPGGRGRLRGAHLVGCDGESSAVRRQAGIGFPAGGLPYRGLFADVDASPDLQETFNAGLYPTGMAAAMPLEPGTVRLMVIELEVEPDDVPPSLAALRAMTARITGAEPRVGEARWVDAFGGYTRLADRYRSGRVLLAGDAAHTLFISGTQGLNAGLQDAVNLGWKLAADAHGWAPPGLLDSYHAERHPVGHQVVDHARAAVVLLHRSDGRMGPLRQLFGEFLRYGSVHRHLLQLPTAARYAFPGTGGPDAPRPLLGERPRIADVLASDPSGDAAEALAAGRGLLLEVGGGGTPSPAAAWSGRVTTVAARPLPELPAGRALLRPDGYAAFVDPSGEDLAGLRQSLGAWFGEAAEDGGPAAVPVAAVAS